MSHVFLGLDNVNEFYSQHYLQAILARDIKDTIQAWKDAAGPGEDPPPTALRKRERAVFQARERLERLRGVPRRLEEVAVLYADLLTPLGYTLQPVRRTVRLGPHQAPVALLGELLDAAHRPRVQVLCVPHAGGDDAPSPLSRPYTADHLSLLGAPDPDADRLPDDLTVDALVQALFDTDDPPRFILLCVETDLLLLDRTRWPEQRLLAFDLPEILGRKDTATLDVTAALLHATSLAPSQGTPLVDTLDDSSHKHAYGVSEDLKYALRESIELLGNEVLRQRRARSVKFLDADLGPELGRQGLRYMYRLLFLLYLEARPELGYAPMGAAPYRLGYSVDRLRDVATRPLKTPEARNGRTLHDSLQMLFRMIHDGVDPGDSTSDLFLSASQPDAPPTDSIHGTFRLAPLRSHLFDPDGTPLFAGVVFPNHLLQRVLELMSLTRPSPKKKQRGRISYATLGINQLGAVYEALLSFRGFVATQDLAEVKPAKGSAEDRELEPAYFVPLDELSRFDDDEQVHTRDAQGLRKLVVHPKGSFIFRLSGRDRQTSASFYTPQVLTRAVVKYALKELLEDEQGNPRLSSSEILELTVCEPAMGSAAFLNEAVDQLADAYLKLPTSVHPQTY